MLASEFLQPYPRHLSENHIHRGAEPPAVREVQDYSYTYGRIVHAAMNDQPDHITPLLPKIVSFEESNTFGDVELQLLNTPGAWRYRNEVNFYALNTHMDYLWRPLIHNAWPNNNRTGTLHFAMNALAYEGMKLYGVRESIVRSKGSEELYTEENKDVLERFSGALQEVDAAIVVIDAIRKHENLTVVPAPLQFERSAPQTNADLLVIDTTEKRMVGVQVKSRVTSKDVDRYDPDRIVLLDGDIDLGNIRVVRTKKRRSTTEPKPWPGIVAASRVHNIKLHGKHQQINSAYSPLIAAAKMFARDLVGSLRVDHRDLSGAIEQRIMNKL